MAVTIAKASPFATGAAPAVEPVGSELVHYRAEAQLSGIAVAGDPVPLAVLPAGAVLVDWALDNDATTGAVTVDVGVIKADGSISTDAADGGKFKTATALTAAACVARQDGTAAEKVALARMTPAAANRVLGIKVAAGANITGTVKVGLSVAYRATCAGN